MASITAIILTYNEENYLEDCLKSIKSVADRIVVVDSFSKDKTVQIAEQYGAEVIQHEFYNHARQFIFAADAAKVDTEWVLKIDADERLTEESARELEELCCRYSNNQDINGIRLRFYQMFMGRALKHGGFYPWKKLCVYRTGTAIMEDRNMDEHLVLTSGKQIDAEKDSVHEAFRNMEFFVKKRNWYSTKEAMDYFEHQEVDSEKSNIKTRIKMNVYYKLPMGFRAWLFYVYCYYFRLGFMDGKEGKIYCFMHAYWYRYLIDAKIYEHQKNGDPFKSTGVLE